MPVKDLTNPCVDCKDAESVATLRKRQLCRYANIYSSSSKLAANSTLHDSGCLVNFVRLKVVRRLGKFRHLCKPTDARLKLLLPLSYGVSSSVLLHILDADLKRQRSKVRAWIAYDLHILIIEPSTISPSNPSTDLNFEAVQNTFPTHAISRVPFYSIFEHIPEIKEIMLEYAGSQFTDDSSQSDQERLAAFRASIPTATSKTDVDAVLLTRLVVALAKKFACEGVLWGDSDSRLAAKTLAGVAKGRGASLTWQASDGMSPWGLRFEFPLRDLFKAELHQYANFCPELAEIIIPEEPPSDNVLTRNLSIDELMMRYVQTQGEKYPGVMGNVARTVNKLQSPESDDAPLCALCAGPVGNVKGNSGVTVSSPSDKNQGSQFCYGCMRSRPDFIR